MSAVRLPVTKVAELYAALDAACEHTTYGGAGAHDALWKRLNAARSFVRVYMLDEAPDVEVEVREAA